MIPNHIPMIFPLYSYDIPMIFPLSCICSWIFHYKPSMFMGFSLVNHPFNRFFWFRKPSMGKPHFTASCPFCDTSVRSWRTALWTARRVLAVGPRWPRLSWCRTTETRENGGYNCAILSLDGVVDQLITKGLHSVGFFWTVQCGKAGGIFLDKPFRKWSGALPSYVCCRIATIHLATIYYNIIQYIYICICFFFKTPVKLEWSTWLSFGHQLVA